MHMNKALQIQAHLNSYVTNNMLARKRFIVKEVKTQIRLQDVCPSDLSLTDIQTNTPDQIACPAVPIQHCEHRKV